MYDRKLWSTEQDQAIIVLVARFGANRWTAVSNEMKKQLPHCCRSSKQIRERWHNQLSPSINKSEWTEEEEAVIFAQHRVFGNRWKEIAKELDNRTDNAVKNRFYSTIRRSLRRINKYFGYRNSTAQMRALKPNVLSRIIEASKQTAEANKIMEAIFQFSKFKPVKNYRERRQKSDEEFRAIYEGFLVNIAAFKQEDERKAYDTQQTIDPHIEPLETNDNKEAHELQEIYETHETSEVRDARTYHDYRHKASMNSLDSASLSDCNQSTLQEQPETRQAPCPVINQSTRQLSDSSQLEQFEAELQSCSSQLQAMVNYFGHTNSPRWFDVNEEDEQIDGLHIRMHLFTDL